MDDFVLKIQQAAVIVCHAGTGTLSHALRAGKVPVVMPRRKKYGEHVDDHQLELVRALALEGRVIPVYEPEELPAVIAESRRRKPMPMSPSSQQMSQLVAKAIEELIGT
jgi:UDP-N-acetylglucosamine transferase subunit ALG13